MAPGQWQIEAEQWRLLVLTSVERDWLRAMIPIMPEAEALPLAAQLLDASFDRTREARFALQNGVLWAVFQHRLSTLNAEDLQSALSQLLQLHTYGTFEELAEAKLKAIVLGLQGQQKSLEEAYQMLERLYDEGVLGDLGSSREEREKVLQVWRQKLARLWQQTDYPQN